MILMDLGVIFFAGWEGEIRGSMVANQGQWTEIEVDFSVLAGKRIVDCRGREGNELSGTVSSLMAPFGKRCIYFEVSSFPPPYQMQGPRALSAKSDGKRDD